MRQIKEYLDNVEDQDQEPISKMKDKLNQVASAQRITLFDEDEVPDPSVITEELIQ